jgi:hypothetical protein
MSYTVQITIFSTKQHAKEGYSKSVKMRKIEYKNNLIKWCYVVNMSYYVSKHFLPPASIFIECTSPFTKSLEEVSILFHTCLGEVRCLQCLTTQKTQEKPTRKLVGISSLMYTIIYCSRKSILRIIGRLVRTVYTKNCINMLSLAQLGVDKQSDSCTPFISDVEAAALRSECALNTETTMSDISLMSVIHRANIEVHPT